MNTEIINAIKTVLEQCEPKPVPYQPLGDLSAVINEWSDGCCHDEPDNELLDTAEALLDSMFYTHESFTPPAQVYISPDVYQTLRNVMIEYMEKHDL